MHQRLRRQKNEKTHQKPQTPCRKLRGKKLEVEQRYRIKEQTNKIDRKWKTNTPKQT